MDGTEKLHKDLEILAGFVEQMPAYLNSETLFWPMGPFSPQLTCGGYLMRQRRLLLLRDLLSDSEQGQLDQTLAAFNSALDGYLVRFEQKCQQELSARLRQWTEYLRDLRDDRNAFTYYATAVEPRVMIDAIVEQLSMPPHQLESDVPARLPAIDRSLQARWLRGDFVWPEAWQPAYPPRDYWYLYGQPADVRQ